MANPKEDLKGLKIVIPVNAAFLHKPVMLGGRMESTVNKMKFPTLAEMGWIKEGMLLLREQSGKQHIIPSAAVNHTIVD